MLDSIGLVPKTGLGEINGDLPEEDFGTTSRLAGRKPPMRSRVRLRITSGLPVIRHLGIGGMFTPVLAKHSKSFSLIDCISAGVDRMHDQHGWQRSYSITKSR